MAEHERPEFFDERFATLAAVQEGLAHYGYLFAPIAKEHTEGLVTGPLLHRIQTQVSKRGMSNVAGKVIVTFSGYAHDPRELFAIPEVRAYWRRLDAELPELPALLACFPDLGFNGPGMVRSSKERVEFSPQASRIGGNILGSPALPSGESQRGQQPGRKAETTEGM